MLTIDHYSIKNNDMNFNDTFRDARGLQLLPEKHLHLLIEESLLLFLVYSSGTGSMLMMV
jgi:hypothetical protein